MQEADSLELTTLVDGYANGALSSVQGVRRSPVIFGERPGEPLLAEAGWAALVRIKKENKIHSILFDTGLGKQALLHNARTMKIDLREIEAAVISHGHPDHTAAAVEAVSAIGRDELPMILHPGALRRRAIVTPDGQRYDFWYFLDERALHEKGARLEKTKRPTWLASDSVVVTGEIPRVTEYERGMPPNSHYSIIDGNLVHDPQILDDQSLVINLRDKGLVVISGCAHAGIINTIRYATEVSGVDKVHAVIGGFHLAGNFYGPAIDKTVVDMKEYAPRIVIPSHCTGMRAIGKIVTAMPESFAENCVGTTFQL